MENNPIQHYKEQSISTMTPGELLLLLYDELVKNLMRCGLALDKNEFDLLETSVEKSLDIIRYLDDTLNRQYEISKELHALYDYFDYQLARVKIGRNKAAQEDVLRMVMELRDSFRQAEKNCADEQEKKLQGELR